MAAAVVQAAWDAGVRFFDIAPLYGYGIWRRGSRDAPDPSDDAPGDSPGAALER